MVRKAIHKKSEENVKQVFKHYSKLKNKDLENEELSIKSYVKNMKLRDARTYFRIRGNMIMTKINMKNDKKFSDELWRGDDCQSMDSHAHIIWCPVFAPLREGKDLKKDSDLVNYYQQVIKIREERENEKMNS